MQMQTAIAHTVENGELSLYGDSVIVTDSKTRDSVTVRGTNPVQVLREIRWFVRYRSGSHNEGPAQLAERIDALESIAQAVQEELRSLKPEKAEEVAS